MSALVWRQLNFPSDLESEQVLDFLRALAMRPRRGLWLVTSPVVFEVRADHTGVSHWLGTGQSMSPAVLAQLHVHLPNLRVLNDAETGGGHESVSAGRVWELRLSAQRRALRTDAVEQISSALLASLHGHLSGEVIIVQWIIGPWLPRPAVKPVAAQVRRSWLDVGGTGARVPADSEEALSLKHKQAEPVFGVVGRIAVVANGRDRQLRLLKQVVGALQLARASGVGLVRRFLPFTRRRFQHFAMPSIAWPCCLNAAELVGIIGWPVGHPVLAGLTYGGGRQLPPAQELLVSQAQLNALDDDKRGNRSRFRIVGASSFPGRDGYLSLSARDALQHCLVIGPTGSGKSELLGQLILQDINAGRAVVVIDPKGTDLIDAVLDRLPKDRLDDVVLVDPAERVRPVGLNVLVGADPELQADQVVHIFTEVYGNDVIGPRSRDILHSGVLTLAKAGGYSICDLPTLLTNPAMRGRVLSRLRDPFALEPFWSWFEHSIGEAERQTVIAPLMNKLRPFQRSALRNLLGAAKPRFAMRDVFTKRRIVLVSLGKGVIGPETAQLLGALIVSQLWNATLSRAMIEPTRRHPTMVYLDEFASVVKLPTSLGDVLAQARGFGVGLTIAAQHIAQLPAAIRADALNNTKSKVTFQLGSDDAAVFARQLGSGLRPDDLQSLGRFEIYAALTHGSRTLPAASAVTLPLAAALGTAGRARGLSRARYGLDAKQIRQELLERGGHNAPEGPVGQARRRP